MAYVSCSVIKVRYPGNVSTRLQGIDCPTLLVAEIRKLKHLHAKAAMPVVAGKYEYSAT